MCLGVPRNHASEERQPERDDAEPLPWIRALLCGGGATWHDQGVSSSIWIPEKRLTASTVALGGGKITCRNRHKYSMG